MAGWAGREAAPGDERGPRGPRTPHARSGSAAGGRALRQGPRAPAEAGCAFAELPRSPRAGRTGASKVRRKWGGEGRSSAARGDSRLSSEASVCLGDDRPSPRPRHHRQPLTAAAATTTTGHRPPASVGVNGGPSVLAGEHRGARGGKLGRLSQVPASSAQGEPRADKEMEAKS